MDHCDFFKHLHQRRKVGVFMEKCLNHFDNMKYGMIRWGWDKAWNDEDQVPISDACFDLQVCSTTINVTKCGGVFCLSCRRLFVRYTAVETIKIHGHDVLIDAVAKKVTHVQKLTISTIPNEVACLGTSRTLPRQMPIMTWGACICCVFGCVYAPHLGLCRCLHVYVRVQIPHVLEFVCIQRLCYSFLLLRTVWECVSHPVREVGSKKVSKNETP